MTDKYGSTEEQLRRQRSTLADFGLYAFESTGLDDLLCRAVELVSEAMQVELVKIMEHRPEKGDLLLCAGVNWEPGLVGHHTLGDHEHSPAGYALQTSDPVISPDIDTETRFEIPDVLVRHGVRSMANVIIAGAGRPFGVLEVDARQHRIFDADDIEFLRTYANVLAAAIDRANAHRALEVTSREQSVLAHELRHRVKNLLGLVQALVSRTSSEGRTAADFKEAVLGRIHALAVAEDIVFHDENQEVDLRRIAEATLAPHSDDRPHAVRVEGGSVRLPVRSARMIGLGLHELATNSAKHGALSTSEGHVRLRWGSEAGAGQPRLVVVWSEHGGPPVSPPGRRGFGSRLLEDILPREVEGESALSFQSSGVEFRLEFAIR